MNVKKAVITAAGPRQRNVPMQSFVDRDGCQKSALQIIVEESLSAGVDDIWEKKQDIDKALANVPSGAPTILLASALNRRSNAPQPPYGNTAMFTLGYLLAWGVFSGVAVALQWWLEHSGRPR